MPSSIHHSLQLTALCAHLDAPPLRSAAVAPLPGIPGLVAYLFPAFYTRQRELVVVISKLLFAATWAPFRFSWHASGAPASVAERFGCDIPMGLSVNPVALIQTGAAIAVTTSFRHSLRFRTQLLCQLVTLVAFLQAETVSEHAVGWRWLALGLVHCRCCCLLLHPLHPPPIALAALGPQNKWAACCPRLLTCRRCGSAAQQRSTFATIGLQPSSRQCAEHSCPSHTIGFWTDSGDNSGGRLRRKSGACSGSGSRPTLHSCGSRCAFSPGDAL